MTSPTEVVKLSYWNFAIWWAIILAVHVVTGIYTALYAYSYFELKDTYLNIYLVSNHIGMAPPYHPTIAIIHVAMSALHGICIFLMIAGSLWQRSLAFTPWRSCNVEVRQEQVKTTRTTSIILKSFTNVYTKVSDRHGFCGVNSDHFHAVLIIREVIETALQTVQAYRMSMLLPRTLLNRFYVLLMVVNCWSSVVVHSMFFRGDEARRRFVCIILDCVLDLMACFGVELIILLSYTSDYVVAIRGFWDFTWYNDEWAARALNEFRMVLVNSWSDLGSRSIFSLGLIMTTTNLKELLQRLPRNTKRVGTAPRRGVTKIHDGTLTSVVPKLSMAASTSTLPSSQSSKCSTNLRTRGAHFLLRTAHLLLAGWGLVVLGLHIQASVQPTLPQCLMQVRPWGGTRPSCYLVGLDCYTLDISGTMKEVEVKWSEFDSSTVVQLLIRHCPSLEMPNSISNFHELHGIKVYNSTINDWGESAAITNTNHPHLANLYLVRTNMMDGVLPMGFQSTEFPQFLSDIQFCVTNLREIPSDLDLKWNPGGILQFEYSQLTLVPPVLMRLEPTHFSVTGNSMTEVPQELFEVTGMTQLGIGAMNLVELPRNVTSVSTTLSFIYIGETDISFFWSWADELLAALWVATDSPYCTDLAMIENGTAETFGVPLSPAYSTVLMDPSEENRQNILNAVYCAYFDPSLYPIVADDYYLAISTPDSLGR